MECNPMVTDVKAVRKIGNANKQIPKKLGKCSHLIHAWIYTIAKV